MRATALYLAAAMVATAEPATSEAKPKPFTPAQKSWWAFQPLKRPAVPAVKDKTWARNEIDSFVLAKLEEKGLKPNAQADKVTLLRRAHLTVTGLPPTPAELQAFLSDNSTNAWEKVVDGLLASKHYGERWGRHWLDLARYADSEGFKSDETRPNVWRYRDYVINSLNADKPYDRFIQEQIAGDEMFPGDKDALVAVGFNRHFPDESNAANIMQRRQELLNDITDVVGSTMMAMTYGCARCHDHKFDPILQKDYYRLQAFFANTRIEDEVALVSPEARANFQAKQAAWEEATADVRTRINAIIEPRRQSRYKERLTRFPEEIQAVINMAPEKRNAFEWQMYQKAKAQVTFSDEEIAGALKGADKEKYNALKAELAKFNHLKPKALPIAQTMVDQSTMAPPTFILSKGAYDVRLDEVQPGFLSILDPSDVKPAPLAEINSTGRRSALAKWLSSPQNPLTTRVIVNRMWHYAFGRGISATPSDFGLMGERPSNRELLDWLTYSFVNDDKWSMKAAQKRILMSAAFQQSSAHRADAAEVDPDNKYMWRFNRRRLEGEIIRDSMLHTAGVLNGKLGGPSVFPPMPPGMTTRGGWAKETADNSVRRSVYTFVRRNTRYPMFEAFDMPDTHEPCARRNLTTTSTQALELLNNELVVDWAEALAKRARNDAGMSRDSQVERAYKLAYQRNPSAEELKSATGFLDRQTGITKSADAAFVDLCHMLLNSNEFVFIN